VDGEWREMDGEISEEVEMGDKGMYSIMRYKYSCAYILMERLTLRHLCHAARIRCVNISKIIFRGFLWVRAASSIASSIYGRSFGSPLGNAHFK
jgi:hypothetical protein